MILGAILAGGQSRRFGSDKAVALLDGMALVDHVAQALAPACDALIIIGHDHASLARIDDRPGPGHGPLGGLNAALHHAVQHGFDNVLTAPCDAINLPVDLRDLLQPGPAFVASQPVIGLWPSSTQPVLEAMLQNGAAPAVRAFADAIGARATALPQAPANINRPEDLTDWTQAHGR